MFSDSDDDIKIVKKKKINKKVIIDEFTISDIDIEHFICLNIFDEYSDLIECYSELNISNYMDDIDNIFNIITNIDTVNCIHRDCGTINKCSTCNSDYKESIYNNIIGLFEKRKQYQKDISTLRLKVDALLLLDQPEQRSQEWYNLRNGMITTSDWASVLSNKKYKNPYSSRKELLMKKCGMGKPFTGNYYTQWGVKYEAIANSIYEHKYNTKILEFGLIQHPVHKHLGASPDGISTDGIMLEIKCPPKRQITDKVPGYYWVQVQGQLEVCDLERCDFLQCKIEEYYDELDYFQDTNLYRGCVLEYTNTNTNQLVYFYSEFRLDIIELNNWEKTLNITDNLINQRKTFWYLSKIACMPIYRNREWFNESLPELTQFWDDVIAHRNMDDIERTSKLKVKTRAKSKPKPVNTIKLNYIFSESEDDD